MAAPARDHVIRLLIGFLTLGLFAQTIPPTSPPSDNSKEGAIVESQTTSATFENDGTGMRVNTVRVRVQSDAGVRRFGLLTFLYQSSVESLDIAYMRVRKADGSVVETPPDNFQDMAAAITREAPFYSDLREKHVAVKGLGAGDLLEYQCIWKLNKPLAAGQFWMDYNFNNEQIVSDEQLEVRVPKQRAVKFKSPTVSPVIQENGNYRVYTWKTSNQKSKVESDEDKMMLLVQRMQGRQPQPDVRFSSFQSWEEVGRWYSDLQKERVKPTPEIAAKAAELTKSATDETAMLKAIYHYVSADFRYIGIDFGIGRYQPHSAADVLGNQYGDCKDKHTLLASLLAAVGIKAYPALIGVARDADPDVPSPSQFDHVITVVPLGQDLLWLDTTPEVAPFGFLLSPLLGKQALVMREDKPAALTPTPSQSATRGTTVFHIDAKLDGSGVLEGKIERENQGDDKEVFLRAAFRRVPLAQWKDLIQQISYQSSFAGDVSDVTASAPEATDQPMRFSYSYKRKDYPDWENHRVSPPMLPILLPPAPDAEMKSKAPIWLGQPQEIHTYGTLKLPGGYEPQLVPAAINVAHDYAEYHATYEFKDRKLIVDRRLLVKLENVPAKEESDYKTFLKTVTDDRDNYVVFVSQNTLFPAGLNVGGSNFNFQNIFQQLPDSKNEEANKLEDEALNAMQKNFRDVIPFLERAVDADPIFARGWVMLGAMYLAAARNDEGMNALRKAVKAEPKQADLYKFIGSQLMLKKKYEDALGVWKQLIANVPDDKEGPGLLGATLVALKHYDEGAQQLENAVEQNPERYYLRIQLGSAYYKAGKKDKGLETMHKALEVEASASALNNVAYELSELKEDLPQALVYAQKAVAEEEALSGKTRLATLKIGEAQHMGPLAAYWDTLGWIHFRLGDYEKAEKYLQSAWALSQEMTPGEHLGEVYEQEHKIDAAREMYRQVLGTIPPYSNDDTDDLQQRIKKLNPHPEKRSMAPYAAGPSLSAMRTTKLPRLVPGEASAEFFVIFAPGPKVEDVKFISGSAKLKTADHALRSAKFDIPFPDESNARIVRRGIVSCYPLSGCSFVLLLPGTFNSVD